MKLSSSAYKIILPVILFGLLAGGLGVGLSARFNSQAEAEDASGVVCEAPEGEVVMKDQEIATGLKPAGKIPPLDAEQPARTETATFALG